MYILSNKIENPEQEIFCPWTGESYVYIDDVNNIEDKTILEGALEILPERFFKRPMAIRDNNGQVKIFVKSINM
jgi:hypothetical protein